MLTGLIPAITEMDATKTVRQPAPQPAEDVDAMPNMLTRLLRGLTGRRAPTTAPERPTPPPLVQRDVTLDPHSPVRVGEIAASRIIQASRGRRDPLALNTDREYVENGRSVDRVAVLACAHLQGLMKVPDGHPRSPLHPVTEAMLTLAGIDPDAFSAIAALQVPGGLYVDGPSGHTMAKAIFDSGRLDPGETAHVRVRVPAVGARPPMVWWQERDGETMLAVPGIPITAIAMLPGRPLSDVLEDPAEGRHDLVVAEAQAVDSVDSLGPATLIKLREREAPANHGAG